MDSLSLNSKTYFLGGETPSFMISGRGADTQMPVASLTKIMTAYAALEYNNLDDKVTITDEMLQGLDNFAVIGLQAGQVATIEDLLYATMLPSAGDAAQALAIHTAGSIEGFAERMNTLAADIGMENTHFSNPVGFDEDNYSTARDIALLLREALKNQNFVDMFETYEKELSSIGKTATKTFPRMNYIVGGKTGYTDAAGRCLATTTEIEGKQYLLVTLGAPTDGTGHLEDTETIYRAIEENYEPVTIIKDGEMLARVDVVGSPTKALEWSSHRDVTVTLPVDFAPGDLTFDYEGKTEIWRDFPAGNPIGSYVVKYKDEIIYQHGLYLSESCEGLDKTTCVAMPEFYSLGWVAGGMLVSFALMLVAIWSFWKSRKLGDVKIWKFVRWGSLVALIVSIIVTCVLFGRCFATGEPFEIYRPVITNQEQVGQEENAENPAITGVPMKPADGEGPASSVVANADNCTVGFGNLMLINPNFSVNEGFINGRRGQLISISQTYGIREYHPQGNGDNLMVPEAAEHLDAMLAAYRTENPGHEMGTYSCFRARGTSCGRLCAATGTSDHHTGLTCDLIDLEYGSELNTDYYNDHEEWQWLHANSYKYGFIDRFPEAWAGGLMSEPLNVDANGSTGLFETWHYRYVGVEAATEIASGKYNNGRYDSLEHYLKATGRVKDLKAGVCI